MKEDKIKKREQKVHKFYKSFGEPSGDELIAYFVNKLETSTNVLCGLTITLAILTIALVVMTAIDIWG